MSIKIFKNQKFLFLLFIAILMITSVILEFRQTLTWQEKIVNILAPLGLQIVFFSLTRRPGIMFLIFFPKLFIDAFQFALIDLYGGSIIGSDMFINLVTTSVSEAGEVLSGLKGTLAMVFAVYIPAIIIAINSARSKEKLSLVFRRRNRRGGIIAILACLAFATGCKADNIYPYNVIHNFGIAAAKWHKVTKYDKTSQGFKYHSYTASDSKGKNSNGKKRIFVLLLGETSRAANFGVYGYDRNTSPMADSLSSLPKHNLLVFKDFLTQSNTTHKSVPIILTPAEASNYEIVFKASSIVSAFKEAGFRTVFISNQNYDKSLIKSYYNEADEHYKISSAGRATLDNLMLPVLDKVLAEYQKDTSSKDWFILIHAYGSHFNYQSRYPKEKALFTPDRVRTISGKNRANLINAYDNSILNADYMLGTVINRINALGKESVLMYLSDHGEDLRDDKRGRFLHASANVTYWQIHIPYMVWFSDSYIDGNPEKYAVSAAHVSAPLSSNSVFHSMLDYASIHTNYLDSTLCIGSSKLAERERDYLTDHDKPVKIDSLGFAIIDRKQFYNRGLKLR